MSVYGLLFIIACIALFIAIIEVQILNMVSQICDLLSDRAVREEAGRKEGL